MTKNKFKIILLSIAFTFLTTLHAFASMAPPCPKEHPVNTRWVFFAITSLTIICGRSLLIKHFTGWNNGWGRKDSGWLFTINAAWIVFIWVGICLTILSLVKDVYILAPIIFIVFAASAAPLQAFLSRKLLSQEATKNLTTFGLRKTDGLSFVLIFAQVAYMMVGEDDIPKAYMGCSSFLENADLGVIPVLSVLLVLILSTFITDKIMRHSKPPRV